MQPADAQLPPLPPSLRRLWGDDDVRRPGQRPSLDIRQVAGAAIALADEGGLDAVAMSRVATSLGVTTMALYRYVDSKDELLELMLEVAAGDPPPLEPDLDWRASLTAWASNLAAVYRRHPWATEIPLPGPPRGPHQLAWAEQGLSCLRETTLPPIERFGAVMLLLVYVRGEASLQQQFTRARERAGTDEAEMERQFERLASGLDPERFPELTAAMSEDPHPSPPSDADPWFGLERVLDGIELLVRRRRRPREVSTPPSGTPE